MKETTMLNPKLFDRIGPKYQIEDVKTIELKEVHGGGVADAPSGVGVMIPTIELALELTLKGAIQGFYIGGRIPLWTPDKEFSPVGVVRKWGTEEGVCQIKQVDFLGREGSGCYDHVESVAFKRFLRIILDLATIHPDGLLQKYLSEKGRDLIPEEDCSPKFKAL